MNIKCFLQDFYIRHIILIMNKDTDEEELVKVIKRVDEFELFLKKTYLEISKYAKIEKIDFLIEER